MHSTGQSVLAFYRPVIFLLVASAIANLAAHSVASAGVHSALVGHAVPPKPAAQLEIIDNGDTDVRITGAWTPSVPLRERWQVYVDWGTMAGLASNAQYTVHHEGGATTLTKDQRINGQYWNYLGTFVLAPGQGHRVVLSDRADAKVAADAIELIVDTGARLARWSGTAAEAGSYRFYARWPAAAGNAYDAPYAVTHSGGTSTVTRNQQIDGGQWNLLGTHTLAAGATWAVELSDQAHGDVIADAVYVVREGATADAFTWTPTIPAADSYQVYARWPASSANTASATYTVIHGGGTTTVTLNQKQNGGTWVSLGSYGFAPSSGHKVSLAASAAGATIADAVLLVGAAAPPANLLYVHADHLGSPQKLTDASQAIVWDGQFDPFGEEVALTGLATLPLRFPGQYADEESGLSYNYLRDYDPTLGRYLQSDPIGLAGGLNTYGYVEGNPVVYVDPTGEFVWLVPIVVVGATSGALTDAGLQLLLNGGRWECIDPWSVALSAGLGAAGGGLRAIPSLVRRPGMVASHWVPDRYIRPLTKSRKNPNRFYKPWLDTPLGRWFVNGPLNRGYVSPRRHYWHDPYYYGNSKAYLNWGEKFPAWLQQADRIPDWIKGGVGGSLLGPWVDGRPACECE